MIGRFVSSFADVFSSHARASSHRTAFATMMINQLARAAVRPQRFQRRSFFDWMTNYPDRVSSKGNGVPGGARKVERIVGYQKTRIAVAAAFGSNLCGRWSFVCLVIACWVLLRSLQSRFSLRIKVVSHLRVIRPLIY